MIIPGGPFFVFVSKCKGERDVMGSLVFIIIIERVKSYELASYEDNGVSATQ